MGGGISSYEDCLHTAIHVSVHACAVRIIIVYN